MQAAIAAQVGYPLLFSRDKHSDYTTIQSPLEAIPLIIMHLYALSLASILPQRYQPIRAYIIHVFCLLRAYLYIIFRPKYNKKNVLTIYFPPVLGLGDTILLSQIVPLVRSYFSNITIQVATSTPWVCASTQNVQYISTNDYVALAKTKYLVISAFSPFFPYC